MNPEVTLPSFRSPLSHPRQPSTPASRTGPPCWRPYRRQVGWPGQPAPRWRLPRPRLRTPKKHKGWGQRRRSRMDSVHLAGWCRSRQARYAAALSDTRSQLATVCPLPSALSWAAFTASVVRRFLAHRGPGVMPGVGSGSREELVHRVRARADHWSQFVTIDSLGDHRGAVADQVGDLLDRHACLREE